MKIHTPDVLVTDAKEAIEMLKAGNKRYLTGEMSSKNTYNMDRNILANAQKPFAVILCCSDSRVAPEIFFDQRLGDIFVVRNAGNVADKTALGSIEYATEHLGTPLVVVIGHGSCGAVTAACSEGKLPENIKHIVNYIQPAVDMGGDIDTVAHHNVDIMVEQVRNNEIIKHVGATVIGAYYDIVTGIVEWKY